MAKKGDFSPAFLRELALNFPKVQEKLIERRQIEQDGQVKVKHTKPSPAPKPSWEKRFSKIETYKKDNILAHRQATKESLKENEKEVRQALKEGLEKAHIGEIIEEYSDMNDKELVTFLEKGHEKMLEQRLEKELFQKEAQNNDKDEIAPMSSERIEQLYFNREITKEYEENSKDIDKPTPSEPSDDLE